MSNRACRLTRASSRSWRSSKRCGVRLRLSWRTTGAGGAAGLASAGTACRARRIGAGVGQMAARTPDLGADRIPGEMASPFGARLRRWRHHHPFSPLALAVQIGSTARHLSFLETGPSRPSRQTVLRLGEAARSASSTADARGRRRAGGSVEDREASRSAARLALGAERALLLHPRLRDAGRVRHPGPIELELHEGGVARPLGRERRDLSAGERGVREGRSQPVSANVLSPLGVDSFISRCPDSRRASWCSRWTPVWSQSPWMLACSLPCSLRLGAYLAWGMIARERSAPAG